MKRKTDPLIRRAVITTLPVLAGYLVLGAGFSMMMASKGYGPLWAIAMSLFVYAGAMQYLAVDLLASGAGLLTTALTTLAVNARHLFYGISMVDKFRSTGWRRPYLIFALTDESYSQNCGQLPPDVTDGPRYYFWVSLLNQCYWLLGTSLGALLGAVIPFSTEGVDFALTALYITVFIDQWKQNSDHIPALIGLGSAAFCLALFGPNSFLIPAMGLITLLLALYRRKGGAKYG